MSPDFKWLVEQILKVAQIAAIVWLATKGIDATKLLVWRAIPAQAPSLASPLSLPPPTPWVANPPLRAPGP